MRSLAAKELASLRGSVDAKMAGYRRRMFLVYSGNTHLESYGPWNEILYGESPPCDPTGHFRIIDVIADIERRYHLPTMDDPVAPDDGEPGFGALDLTIWRDGRLLAVIRRGAGGGPVVSRFDI